MIPWSTRTEDVLGSGTSDGRSHPGERPGAGPGPAYGRALVQAPFARPERTTASTNSTPATPSWTVGRRVAPGSGSRPSSLARISSAASRVDVGEALEETLRGSRRGAGSARRGRPRPGPPRAISRGGSRRAGRSGGSSGPPAPRSRPPFSPIDAEPERVLVAGRGLARPEHALGAADEAQQHVAVVVEPAARDEGGQVGRDLVAARGR